MSFVVASKETMSIHKPLWSQHCSNTNIPAALKVAVAMVGAGRTNAPQRVRRNCSTCTALLTPRQLLPPAMESPVLGHVTPLLHLSLIHI